MKISKQREPNSGILGWIQAEARPLLVMVLLLAVARTSFANHYSVPSGSMEDTLMTGDRVFVDMTAYGVRVPFTDIDIVPRGVPQRGDIAVFKSPLDGTRLIKRVVAVGGDEVSLVDGRLTINGRPLASASERDVEWFGPHRADLNLDYGGGPDIPYLVVPRGKVLMVGDHRGNSRDGRVFGLVDSRELYARAVSVYYRRGEGLVWKKL
ncbi:signal peptidase I [Luteimonas sp. SX5]|uniref:Signal peptidase I n=1 Tax=Luteimonas galliterrae TaxID=2940486 RepID=A0ABT0MHZ4_9GAMM|nr:signal peptidase I [Luteimonas galliterrae]MCL1634494.1 signal peptidase I [Luteimonas galliterrae]